MFQFISKMYAEVFDKKSERSKKQDKSKQAKTVIEDEKELKKITPDVIARVDKAGVDTPADEFVVKRSRIPKAGKGLFLNKTVKKGDKLLEYTGKEVDRETAAKSGYGLMLRKGVYIDAKNDSGKARYINAPPLGVKANVRISLNKDRTKAYVVALHKLEPGEELYMGYGAAYWKQHKKHDE